MVAAFSAQISTLHPFEAELLALLKAPQLIKNMSLKQVVIETDSLIISRAHQNQEMMSWYLMTLEAVALRSC